MTAHQLLVLWEKGRSHEAALVGFLDDDPDIRVVGTVEVTWPAASFASALGQLYGERLPSRSEKQQHCGSGPFLVIIVEDLDPRPGLRRTARGVEPVDTHVFDIKQQARQLTGGGHRIHATDSAEEFSRDLPVLTGMTADELWRREPWDRETRIGAPDGAEGWSSVAAMLQAIGRRMPYCVLRNHETWDRFGPTDDHPDIDLLVAARSEAANVLAATPTSRRRGRVQHRVRIGDRAVNVDLRTPADGYFPRPLAERALAGAQEDPRGWLVPAPADHVDTLAYHALVHRHALSDDYRERLLALDPSLELDDADGQRRTVDRIAGDPTLPSDPSVRFNSVIFGSPAGLARRRAAQWVRSSGVRGLRRLGVAT